MSKGFSIKYTVNKNIEKNQFPSFSNHRSLVGWCSMNYPKVLVNPIYLQKEYTERNSSKYELETLFQMKNPVERKNNYFIKPFSSYTEDRSPIKIVTKYYSPSSYYYRSNNKKLSPAKYNGNTKTSSFTLCTTKYYTRAEIYEKNNKQSYEYSSVLPLKSLVGQNMDGKYDRKIRQIGEVYYNLPNYGEEMRHLKKLPNTIINEQNLLEIMNAELYHLDLSYKTNISNYLINKIGYLAPNIKSLRLASVPITNAVLIELGKSCKNLEEIDISLCKEIEENAILSFLKDSKKIKLFSADHLYNAVTDAVLEQLTKQKSLQKVSINFCKQLTSAGFYFLCNHEFYYLGLSTLPNLKGDNLSKILTKSHQRLRQLNLSFNNSKYINNLLMQKVAMCTRLYTLILTGCENISDEGIINLSKTSDGFQFLKTLKVGGLTNVSDQLFQLIKKTPNIEFIEANNLYRLSDHFLEQLKILNPPYLKQLLINFTPNITDEKIDAVRQEFNKDGKKIVNIIRNINKMTDPADDGLRMPLPLASMKIKKPKKKKK